MAVGGVTVVVVVTPGAEMVVILGFGGVPVPLRVGVARPSRSTTPVTAPTSGLAEVVMVGDFVVYDAGMGGTGGGVQGSLFFKVFLSGSGDRTLVDGRSLEFTRSGEEFISKLT